jgi:hypothetical protein
VSAFHIQNVTAALAALTIAVPKLSIRTEQDMLMQVIERDCPLLGPSSDPSFLTDWETRRISLQGNQQNSYTLNYTYFQAPVGQDRSLFAQYPVMVEHVKTIVDALQTLSAVDGCKSIALEDLPRFGPVHDAMGNVFVGATLSLRVIEF